MNKLLIILLLCLLVSPALAGTKTITMTPGTPSGSAVSGYKFLYNSSVAGIPISYTVEQAGVDVIGWGNWRDMANRIGDHTARFNLSYNNHNYSTVSVVATDLGQDPWFNASLPANPSQRIRLDYTFEWVDPDITSLGEVILDGKFGGSHCGEPLYDNITYDCPYVASEAGYAWYNSINDSETIARAIGGAWFAGPGFGTLSAKDGFYSFTSGAAPAPTPTPGPSASTLQGHTNNALTNATLAAVTVTSSQASATNVNISDTNGNYKLINLANGESATISATKSGYTQAGGSFSFTPAGSTSYIGNISMMPAFVPNTTASIIGIIYTSWSGVPIQGATVSISNATWSTSTTSTVTGFYQFDRLAAAEAYTVSASKTGFVSSASYGVTTVGGITVQQDIPLGAQYVVTLTAKDGSTGVVIQSTPVFFESSDGQTANSTTGSATFTVTGGYLTFTASATGYTAGQQSATVTSDTSLVLLLYKTSESSGVQISVPPHHVKFIVRNQNGLPLDNVLVTAQGEQTTVGTWDWLLSIFGIGGWTSTPIHNTSMTGSTDSRGEIDFLMFPEIKYNMSFVKSGFINNRTYLYPHYDEYSIVVPSALWFVNGSDVNRYINWSITRTLNSDTDATITVRYNDTLSHTSKIIIDLRKADNAQSMSRTPIANCSWTGSGGSSLTCSFHVADYRLPANNSYYLNGTSLSQDFGRVQRDFGITFPIQQPLEPFHLPDLVLFLISALILFCIGMLFGATSSAQGSLVVCIIAWVLWFMGMMDYIANMNPAGFFIGLALATVTAVYANFTVAQRQEGYP